MFVNRWNMVTGFPAVNVNFPQAKMGLDLDDAEIMKRKRVLVVEDEPNTTYLLKFILRERGYNVMSAVDGKEAVNKVREQVPDMILLDMMLPEMDGWETLGTIRQMSQVPVIIVSALTGKDQVVRGLKSGADDYIPKPFHNQEVIERVEAVFRRSKTIEEPESLYFKSSGLKIEIKRREVEYCGKHVELAAKEFEILSILAKHEPNVVRYSELASEVWGEDSKQVRTRIKYLIYLIRRKLAKVNPDAELILAVNRLGYRLAT